MNRSCSFLVVVALALSGCGVMAPLSMSKDAEYIYRHANPATGEVTEFSIQSRRDVAGPSVLSVAPDGTVSVTTGGLTAAQQAESTLTAALTAMIPGILARSLGVPSPDPSAVTVTTTPAPNPPQ